VPKKVEAPVIPPPRVRPQSVITISSMEAPIINYDGPIIIKKTSAQKKDKVPKEVARDEESSSKEIPSIANPCGVLVG
jgi:hypothetical protein